MITERNLVLPRGQLPVRAFKITLPRNFHQGLIVNLDVHLEHPSGHDSEPFCDTDRMEPSPPLLSPLSTSFDACEASCSSCPQHKSAMTIIDGYLKYSCPHCGHEMSHWRAVSSNSFGSVLYSDGIRFGPMSRDMGIGDLFRCSKCSEFLRMSELEPVFVNLSDRYKKRHN